jgi:hypothetical protein
VFCIVRGQVILHFDAFVDLANQAFRSAEHHVFHFRNEPEEVSMERDPVGNSLVKIFTIIVRLEGMTEDGKPLWSNFSDPESNNIGFVKKQELSSGRRIANSSEPGLHTVALDRDLVGRQQTECQITSQNGLDALLVVVVVVRGQAVPCETETIPIKHLLRSF